MDDRPLRLDFAALCASHGIAIANPGDRHYREGWVCLPCPFCTGQEGNHLGFNKESNVFTCFRCGRHGKFKVLSALLGVTLHEAGEVAKRFSLDQWQVLLSDARQKEDAKRKIKKTSKKDGRGQFILPGVERLLPRHRDYLLGRGFDPDRVFTDWGLRCVDKVGWYAYRIVIPITYKGKVVTFTTRDITGEQADRYLACPPEEALRHHKYCVYGIDQSPYGKTCVIVEGPAGVWRIGKGSGCTCGTGWTHEQAKIIARYRKSYIFFDPEEKEAGERADKLSQMLGAYRDHTSYVVECSGAKGRDTGELTPSEVKEIRKVLK